MYVYSCITEIRNKKAEKRVQDYQFVYYQAEFR